MKLETVKLVCFSPTGTTKTVVQGIAKGMKPSIVKVIDITKPETRMTPLRTSSDELLVIGVPVYMGRVPALIHEWLKSIQACNTPTVCVVVYGNRVYDDALLELKDIVSKCGCIPIGGAAYIGEHSFSDSETPTAHGRPDAQDLDHAANFGKQIRKKIESTSSLSQIPELSVPGTFPYGGITELWNVDFIAVDDQCTQCGTCAACCPVAAIDSKNRIINQKKCITCCACIKSCPQNARSMKPGPVKDASKRLNKLCNKPQKPEYYL